MSKVYANVDHVRPLKSLLVLDTFQFIDDDSIDSEQFYFITGGSKVESKYM